MEVWPIKFWSAHRKPGCFPSGLLLCRKTGMGMEV